MTEEETKFLDDNAVVTKEGDVLSVRLCVPMYAGRFKDTRRNYDPQMVTEWLKRKGHKITSTPRGPVFRNYEEAHRDITWSFSLARKAKPAKVPPAKPTKTKKTGKAKQTTNEG